MASGSLLLKMETMVFRSARRGLASKSWTFTSLWRHFFNEHQEEEDVATEEIINERKHEIEADQNDQPNNYEPTSSVAKGKNIKLQTELLHEMRLRDLHGVSLRNHAWDSVIFNRGNDRNIIHNDRNNNARPGASLAESSGAVPDLSVPTALGSTEYIYLPQ